MKLASRIPMGCGADRDREPFLQARRCDIARALQVFGLFKSSVDFGRTFLTDCTTARHRRTHFLLPTTNHGNVRCQTPTECLISCASARCDGDHHVFRIDCSARLWCSRSRSGAYLLARTELQTAADASALTVAGTLLAGGSAPNWSSASVSVATVVSLNSSDGVNLKNTSVQTWFWNLATRHPASGRRISHRAPTTSPPCRLSCRELRDSTAALLVSGLPVIRRRQWTCERDGGSRRRGAGICRPPRFFQVAIGKCIYSQSETFSGVRPDDPAMGEPFTFQIGDGATYGGCEAGQWIRSRPITTMFQRCAVVTGDLPVRVGELAGHLVAPGSRLG